MPLIDVDTARETFAYHCSGCGATTLGLHLRDHMRAHTDRHPEHGSEPGYSALCVDCPCGMTYSMNTGLGPENEDETLPYSYSWHAQQARLVRTAMRFHGLATRETPPDAADLGMSAATPTPTS